MRVLGMLIALAIAVVPCAMPAQEAPLRERAAAALRKAVTFYRDKVASHGGYHFAYAEDLSYGRSEMSEGPTRVELQREGTPVVGMAYLDAYDATRDRYYLDAAREIARALVSGQYCSGGWDYFIEFDPLKRASYPYRVDGRCSEKPTRPTTLDDNVTQAALRLLMRVDRELAFADAPIHDAALFALDCLIRAQYPNGAWPQRYSQFPDPGAFPIKRASYPESWPRTWPGSSYSSHYTFNDNSIVDAIDVMLEAARIYEDPRYRASAEAAGAFILLAQMPEPQPGWAQQYDSDMHPAWARRFEPPSITGGESQSVARALLLLYRETGNRKYLEPLPAALAYYHRSLLPPVENPSEIRSRACPGNTPCVARFYELKTNRPLYITKGTRVTPLDQGAITVDGYDLSYSDESVITHYAVLVSGAAWAEIERDYRAALHAVPASLKRPGKLRGLSPWSEAPAVAADLEPRVREIISAMDLRGAWVEEGVIGKADRVVSVFAAKDMIVTVGGRTLPLKENDTLEVFAGPGTPKQRIIRSRTFARHIAILSAYLAERALAAEQSAGVVLAQAPAPPPAAALTCEEIETFLKKARIGRQRGLPVGVTAPSRAVLDDGQRQHEAVIQTVDITKTSHPTPTGTELNFRDSWYFNVAGYELAKMLGLNMVPPYVERPVSGTRASVSWMVADVMMERDRVLKKMTPPDMEMWNKQILAARVFHELIADSDFNMTNLLIAKDWTVWLIDFTRAFRLTKTLQEPDRLTAVDRKLLAGLRALTRDAMDRRIGRWLERPRIDAVLARRDLLVRLFDNQVAAKGEAAVLYDFPRTSEPCGAGLQ